ncbi:MAG: hypothetical protein GMKNLPBB_00922 [Myxococcota bacterium]|nr:hypothetical protein [Myxococcota bacterium]
MRPRSIRSVLLFCLLTSAAVQNCDCEEQGPSELSARTQVDLGDGKKVTPKPDSEDLVLDFGTVEIGQVKNLRFTLSNNGSFDLEYAGQGRGFAIDPNTLRGEFSLAAATPRSIAPKRSAEIEVSYAPADEGADSGLLNVKSNDDSVPHFKIKLIANGIKPPKPEIEVCVESKCNDDGKNELVIDFGRIVPGKVEERSFTVKNLGARELEVSSSSLVQIDLTGNEAAAVEFIFIDPVPASTDKLASYALKPGEMKTIKIGYKPADGGKDTGRAIIESNDMPPENATSNPEKPVSIKLNAEGVAPKICPENLTIEFGDVNVGASKTIEAELCSCGTEPLTINSITMETGSQDLTVKVKDPLPAANLGNGQCVKVDVTYTPKEVGTDAGKLKVDSNDPLSGQGFIPVTGRGILGPRCILRVAPSAMNFGLVTVGKSADRPLVLTNVGETLCDVTAVAETTGNAAFKLPSPPALPMTIKPGDIVEVPVRCEPAQAGEQKGNIDVTSTDATEAVKKVPLVCNQPGPPDCNLIPIPSLANFGVIKVGTSKELTISVQNTGQKNCEIVGADLSPSSDPEFVIIGPKPSRFNSIDLATGATFDMKVKYTAPAPKSSRGQVLWNVSTGRLAQTKVGAITDLAGAGSGPRLCLNPKTADFGAVALGSQKDVTVELLSCGTETLQLTNVSIGPGSDPRFSIAAPPKASSIPSGQRDSMVLRFDSKAPQGMAAGKTLVKSNDAANPNQEVPMIARAAAPCDLVCEPAQVDFGNVNTGRSVSRFVTCENRGLNERRISSVKLDAGAPDVLLSHAPMPVTLKTGDSLRIELVFSPTKKGPQKANLIVDAAGGKCQAQVFTAPVQGTGQDFVYPTCLPPSTFQPQTKWEWTNQGAPNPRSAAVFMTPMVAPLLDTNSDGSVNESDIPAVFFFTYDKAKFLSKLGTFAITEPLEGTLRAIRGDNGKMIWSATDPALQFLYATHPAVADLDGDGHVEIIGVKFTKLPGKKCTQPPLSAFPGDMCGQFSRGTLLALTHEGKLKWESDAFAGNDNDAENMSAVAVADLDADGFPEVVYSNHVYDYKGRLKWVGQRGRGNDSHGSFVSIADLDGDGFLEVVAGQTAYKHDGTVLWHQTRVGDGYTAIADFDKDGVPEVINHGLPTGKLTMMDGKTGNVRWQVDHGGNGCCLVSPTIADYNGDGFPEIAIPGGSDPPAGGGTGAAGQNYINMFDRNGKKIWRYPITETTGAAVPAAFDFEGDGAYEIIYADEGDVHVLRGDGTRIFVAMRGSATGSDNPVIVDIDRDNHADILLAIDGGGQGIRVYANTNNNWVSTRSIWNQHTYQVTNVNENGSIPRKEPPHWQSFNLFRGNPPYCSK